MNFYNSWLAHGGHYNEATFASHARWSWYLMQMHYPEMSVCKLQVNRRPLFSFLNGGERE